MAEGKGYEAILKINLPPEADYHSGHSLILQGDTVEGVEKHLDTLIGGEGTGKVVLARFAEYALKGGVVEVLLPTKTAGPAENAPATATSTSAKKPAGSASTSEGEASPALKAAAAKKVGKTVDELGSITTSEAKRLMKEGK